MNKVTLQFKTMKHSLASVGVTPNILPFSPHLRLQKNRRSWNRLFFSDGSTHKRPIWPSCTVSTLSWFASGKRVIFEKLVRGHPSIFGVTPRKRWGDASHFLGWRLTFLGGDASHFWGWHLEFLGVTPRKIWGNFSCEASPHCYNFAHIYVSWSYVWKYTNVKLTFLPIKTISRCLTIFVLQILGSNLLRWAILKSSIYFDIRFKLNWKIFSTYNSIWYVLLR